ncbi:uncharacterized protein LOC125069012 [Vanessa atalanta]|uniref:uncharacterized protein LOC125069012 n=1 Tax=Vanessa atalanta TaxID=42275 RepID=UPI001FCDDA8E|nr:uncharacterized protein LOC125069012 [Vanessa atalanta]
MDEISLVQICESNFNDADISTAKTILFEAANCRSTRKGDGKNKRLLQDIIKVLKENEPASLPTFVAKDLHRLPPVTFDYVDVTSLLKDILVLKQNIHCIQTDYVKASELFQLQLEIENIKTQSEKQIGAKSCNGFFSNNEAKHVPSELATNTHAPCCVPSSTPLSFLAPAQSGNAALATASVREPPPAPATTSLPVLTLAPVRVTPSADRTENDITITPKPTELRNSNKTQSRRRTDRSVNTTELIDNTLDEINFNDTFTTVVNNKKKKKTYTGNKNPNQQGKATLTSNKLKIVPKLSYIYASRFDKHTTENDIYDFIKDCGHTVIKVEKLVQYKDTIFSSFKVTIKQDQESVFLSAEFWPCGVEYRKFTFKRKFYKEDNPRPNNEN